MNGDNWYVFSCCNAENDTAKFYFDIVFFKADDKGNVSQLLCYYTKPHSDDDSLKPNPGKTGKTYTSLLYYQTYVFFEKVKGVVFEWEQADGKTYDLGGKISLKPNSAVDLINRVRAKADKGASAVAAATISQDKQVVITGVKQPSTGFLGTAMGFLGGAVGAVKTLAGGTSATADAASEQEL